MIDTPRTDAQHLAENPIGEWNTGKIQPDFARELERELATVTAERDRLEKICRNLERCVAEGATKDEATRLRAERDAAIMKYTELFNRNFRLRTSQISQNHKTE